MKNIIVAMLAFVVISANAAEVSQWSKQVQEDRITGFKLPYVSSPWSKSETALAFPYTDRLSRMGVFKSGDTHVVYVKFSGSMQVTGSQYINGHKIYKLRASIDGKPTTFDFIDEKSGTALYSIDSDLVIDIIKSANTIKLEVPVYQNQAAYFNYNMKGSSKAINEL